MKEEIIKYGKEKQYYNIKNQKIIDFLNNNILFIKGNTAEDLKKKAAAYITDITEEPKCYCGNDLKFSNKNKTTPYGYWNSYCSRTCMQKDPNLNIKKKETKIEKYGKAGFGNKNKWSEEKKKEYNEKRIKTSTEKYGVDHYSKTNEYILRRENTNIQKYGVKNTLSLSQNKFNWFSTDEGKEYLKNNNPMKNEEIKLKHRISKFNNDELFNIILNKDEKSLIKMIEDLCIENIYRKTISENLNISTSYLNKIFRDFNLRHMYVSPKGFSQGEQEIFYWLKDELNLNPIIHDRTILNGMELDILCNNIAIEYNGLLWHSEYYGNKSRNYHLNKTEKCLEKNITLLHIFDVEWNNPIKKEIWKSIIRNKLGLIKNRIFARNCVFMKIDKKEAKIFLNNNHLEGFVGAKSHFGLFYENKLVSVMSISNSRFKLGENEIIRFASLINTVVIGGMSKFIKNINASNLYTYANRRYCGNSYSLIGDLIYATEPNWYGFNLKEYELKHRLKYQKKNLEKMFEYDYAKSAFENMINNGYDRIWDCGNFKYRIKS